MSLEQRVTIVEQKVEQLEKAFHDQNVIIDATHGVVSLILNEQRERFKQVDKRFKQMDERFDQLELLIRQHFKNH